MKNNLEAIRKDSVPRKSSLKLDLNLEDISTELAIEAM